MGQNSAHTKHFHEKDVKIKSVYISKKNGVLVGRKVLYAGRRVTELIQIVEYLKQTTLKVFISNS